MAQLEEALALDHMSPAVGEGMGLALYFAGRIAEAEERFRDILTLDPGFMRAHFDLALCRAAEDDAEGFLDHLLRAWTAGMYGGEASEVQEAEVVRRARSSRPISRISSSEPEGGYERSPWPGWRRRCSSSGSAASTRPWRHSKPHVASITWDSYCRWHPRWIPSRNVPGFHRLMTEAGLLLPRWANGP